MIIIIKIEYRILWYILFNDISDLNKLIDSSDNPDQNLKSKIYNLAKHIFDHSRRYTSKELSDVRTIIYNLTYITEEQKKSLKCSKNLDDICNDDTNNCCSGPNV